MDRQGKVIVKKVQPTRTVTQEGIEAAFHEGLRQLGAKSGVVRVEGVLLFGDEFHRGPTLILYPDDEVPPDTTMEWEDFPPEPYRLVHQAILVMAERPDEDLKELKVEVGKTVLWVYEGRNLVVAVETEWGAPVHKGMWRVLRNLDKHSDAIQRLCVEDALIQNVKDGHIVCSHAPDGSDQFRISDKGIKHVEEDLL